MKKVNPFLLFLCLNCLFPPLGQAAADDPSQFERDIGVLHCILKQKKGYSQTSLRWTRYSSESGLRGQVSPLGYQLFYEFSNGLKGTSTRFGNKITYRFNNGLRGSSTRNGNRSFHDFNNGMIGFSRHLGSVVRHHFENGVRGTTTLLGGRLLYECLE